jgi:hypothetical protein
MISPFRLFSQKERQKEHKKTGPYPVGENGLVSIWGLKKHRYFACAIS